MNNSEEPQEQVRTCFVVMPISDAPPYEPGHFRRVYEHIIKPACMTAGFTPIRADDVNRANIIVIDVLRRIIEADLVLCDLSGRNPNVMYELGVRQAFNHPVVLIKDNKTDRVFDVQGLRDIEYDAALRVDRIGPVVQQIAASLKNTADGAEGEVNSIIQLLGVQPARIQSTTHLSEDASVLLSAIADVGKRLAKLENTGTPLDFRWNSTEVAAAPWQEQAHVV
jgi:hypothetical protein